MRSDAPPTRRDALLRGAQVGAIAGALCAALDVASTILWLRVRADQVALLATLLAWGTLLGAPLGALVAALLVNREGAPVARASLRRRLLGAAAPPAAALAWMLFTGGRMRRLPAVPLLRVGAFVVLLAALTAFAALLLSASRRAHEGSRATRLLAAALGVLSALLFHALDHRLFPRLYEYLHGALGLATLLGFGVAVALLSPRARPRAGLLALWPAVALFSVLALERWPNVRAEVFGVHAPFVRHGALLLYALRPTPSAPRLTFEDASASAELPSGTPSLPSTAGAHVLLLTVDALRADRLEGEPALPTLRRLASSGWYFTRAYAQAPHSSYSLASLHTSEYLHETVPLGQAQPLPTLASRFRRAGWHTAAFYTQGIFFTEGERLTSYRDAHLGFARADHVDRDAEGQVDEALRELDDVRRRGEPPTLLWVHLFDAHEPYQGRGATARERYLDAGVRVDRAVSRLLEGAQQRLRRPLFVALTADHGEEFGEHGGVYHGSTLYEEQVRVPLVLHGPGLSARRIERPVALLDLAPTLLHLARAGNTAGMRGADLRAAALAPRWERPVFGAVNTRVMLVNSSRKLLTDLRYDVEELYDLAADPAEHNNLAGASPSELAPLRHQLRAWLRSLSERIATHPALARARLGDRAVAPELLALLDDRAQPLALREEALGALAPLLDDALAERLSALLSSREGHLALASALLLAPRGSARARALLTDALGSMGPPWRTRAALALAPLGEPLSLGPLLELYATGQEPERIQVVDALGALRRPEGLPLLRDALTDEHLRYRAALSLGALSEPEVPALLERLAREDRAEDVRCNALAALARCCAARAEPLLRAALRDPACWPVASAALSRSPGAGRWSAAAPCALAAEEQPLWRYAEVRACALSAGASLPLGSAPAGLAALYLRARGSTPLRLRVSAAEASVALEPAWRSYRVDLPPLGNGDATLQLLDAAEVSSALLLAR